MRKIVFIALALFWQSPLLDAPDCANWSSEDFWQDASAEDVARCFSGANLEAPDKYGKTPLHRAARYGTQENIKALLDAGANFEAPEIIKALLDAGANFEARDEDGETPLYRAAASGKPETIEALIHAGANLEARNEDGLTPLHLAAADSKPETIEALLDAGADAGARTKAGSTALDLAEVTGLRDNPGGEEVWWLLNDATYNATDAN